MSNEKGSKDEDAVRRIKFLIAESLDVEAKSVSDDASFIDDLGADSLDIVELVMAFEKEFDIEIPDEQAEKIVNVRDATEYILSRLPR